MNIFEETESHVRNYSRRWPVVFDKAVGSRLYDESGRPYLDFFAGAGALNYGHNNPLLKEVLLNYLAKDGITQSLDMWTVPKREFLVALRDVILIPRGLNYKVQFPGPAGTTAVEAAIKLARKVTGREIVVGFEGAFHGMTLGSLYIAGRLAAPMGARSTQFGYAVPIPYDQSPHCLLEQLLGQRTGPMFPAAVIVETIQGEGGINVAALGWLHSLADICKENNILLIVDDIQMGCGRTGPFFSFEAAEIVPDIVCLSKSISGYGLPLALTLLRPELDQWEPGEHSGTFRGFTPAFVTGMRAIELFWSGEGIATHTMEKGRIVEFALKTICSKHGDRGMTPRGRGLIWGMSFSDSKTAAAISREAFDRGLLLETAGRRGEVIKFMPPLTISHDDLLEGLSIFGDAVSAISPAAGQKV